MDFDVVVLAGGTGSRAGGPVPKLFWPLAGEPVLGHSLRRFAEHPDVRRVVVVINPGHAQLLQEHCPVDGKFGAYEVTLGGPTRGHSVLEGLRALGTSERVLIHDGARPLVPPDDVTRVMQAVCLFGAACLCAPVTETIKEADADGLLYDAAPRERLRRALTPQGFSFPLVLTAYEQGLTSGFAGTDCASFVSRSGHPVHEVQGAAWNVKFTMASDLELLSALHTAHARELRP